MVFQMDRQMTGRVMKSTGSWYTVWTGEGGIFQARVRGKMRLDESRETNPVAVGDRVELLIEDGDAVIARVLDRSNHIVRQSARKTSRSHVIAANVDQGLMVATVAQPRTSTGFIDRFLVTCEAYGIPQVLVINKRDLLNADELEMANGWMELYGALGVKTFLVSFKDDLVLDGLESLLGGKTTLLTGHSGTGKSTLLNRLCPGVGQEVGAVSEFTEKGVHTTTWTEMFAVDSRTFVIDTPGIKEWGLLDMTPPFLSVRIALPSLDGAWLCGHFRCRVWCHRFK
jgi:ribosome biogenesis GTPase / thiamine phosphate phosphatase